MDQLREQFKIKELNLEEEIAAMKDQLKDKECQTFSENIELIRLQQEKKNRVAQIDTLRAQLRAQEEALGHHKVTAPFREPEHVEA